MTKQLPTRVKAWLNGRGISDSIIEEYEVGWDGEKITIPVHDSEGKVLFYKYRRDPEREDGPKYKYDKGATSKLYGLKTLNKDRGHVVICEGEFDALCLMSQGIQAVSSTGGSQTWEKEWNKYLEGLTVIICYDHDDAGFRGAYNTYAMVPGSAIAWLPKEVGEHGDVTDYFTKLGKTTADFLKIDLQSYMLPRDWSELKTKKELSDRVKEYKTAIELIMEEARHTRSQWKSDRHLQILLEIYMNKLTPLKRAIKYFYSGRKDMGADRITRAKSVPIPQFVKFNRAGYAICIWHNEQTPSMYYYENQNRVKCFSCSKLGDVIDVVQQIHRVGIQDALSIILGDK